MAKKYLVIVESPAKVKTIKKFLGDNYTVTASNGHIRDLPKSTMGVDVENDFEPKYITIRGKGDKLAELKRYVKKADVVYLATDPDREGEAISWHLAQALKLDDDKMERITFNEITKNAVKESLKHPRKIDMNLVDAQQARRVLDRMVGYSISPLLWKKVKRGLSAGRVQSVALRIICDREAEINAFIEKEYWTLDAVLETSAKKEFSAKLSVPSTGLGGIESRDELDKIIKEVKKGIFFVSDVKKSERAKKPPLPFTTSTMQQEASKQLNFATSKTMRVAQQLYEGVDIKGYGTIALITYLRTDSTRIADEALNMVNTYIENEYGKDYLLTGENAGKKQGKIQDAHEAIRPTDVTITPDMVKNDLPRDLYRLYKLIWQRFVASRMENAKYDTISVKISAGSQTFNASSSELKFDGFLSVYNADAEEKDKLGKVLSSLKAGDKLKLVKLDEKKHFTQPPAHYTEASLVRTLEELGIGRPSTYAPTIATIIARRYVTKEEKNLFVTEIGEAVNEIMKTAFPSIIDADFTATMEVLLDSVSVGECKWKSIIENFYPDLESAVKEAEEKLEKIEIHDEETDVICENCGRKMVIKYGPNGKFLACPGFPECRNTKTYLEKIGVICPKCGKDIVIRRSKKGRRYYGCESNPECDFMSWSKPIEKKCPVCGKYMVEKGKKHVCSDPSCGYVEDANSEK